jgi:hypothetical protein
MDVPYSRLGEIRNAFETLMRKLKCKRQFERIRYTFEIDIKIDFKELWRGN